jgi:hypothetical protein
MVSHNNGTEHTLSIDSWADLCHADTQSDAATYNIATHTAPSTSANAFPHNPAHDKLSNTVPDYA